MNGERSGAAARSGSESRTSLLSLWEAGRPPLGFAWNGAGVPELYPGNSRGFWSPNGVGASDFSLRSFCYLEILAFGLPGLCIFIVLASFACGALGLLIPNWSRSRGCCGSPFSLLAPEAPGVEPGPPAFFSRAEGMELRNEPLSSFTTFFGLVADASGAVTDAASCKAASFALMAS